MCRWLMSGSAYSEQHDHLRHQCVLHLPGAEQGGQRGHVLSLQQHLQHRMERSRRARGRTLPNQPQVSICVRDTSDIWTYTGPKLYNSGKYYNRTLNEYTSPVGYRSKKTTLLTEHRYIYMTN